MGSPRTHNDYEPATHARADAADCPNRSSSHTFPDAAAPTISPSALVPMHI